MPERDDAVVTASYVRPSILRPVLASRHDERSRHAPRSYVLVIPAKAGIQ